jgi:hypothetical protein
MSELRTLGKIHYRAWRIINGKPAQWVIVDESGNIVNRNPTKEELKELEKEQRRSQDTRNFRKYEDDGLLSELIRFEKENGFPPTANDFRDGPEYPNPSTYQKRFGSWSNSLKLVGLDVESMIKKGVLITNNQKARLSEMMVVSHFEKNPIDLAGDNCHSPCDGICPNGKTYDVKSAPKAYKGPYYNFVIKNKLREEIKIYYLLAFNEDWTKLNHVWRIPGEIVEKDNFYIGIYGGEFNIENMEEYEITDRFRNVFNELL